MSMITVKKLISLMLARKMYNLERIITFELTKS